MKRPASPFTIHIYEATYVVKHIASPRHSTWVRARPSMAQGLICVGHGLVRSGLMTVFVVARACYMIARICGGAVRDIRLVHDVSIRWLEFVFITIPLFAMACASCSPRSSLPGGLSLPCTVEFRIFPVLD